jgi:hypothetical protein
VRSLVLVALLATTASASDLADYDPRSQAWNGMASFVGLAEGMGLEVAPHATLDWSDLSATDILVLVYPLQRVDPMRLGNFVQAGGNVVIADDFGEGKDAMAQLGLLRADVTSPHASRYYQGKMWAPIAAPRADHPIAAQIGSDAETGVVTNHPAALTRIEGATAVIGFDDDNAVVVAGERGTGRFIALSDPSVLINRMQQFAGNVQLAANMLHWLSREGRARRIVLLRGDVPIFGDPRPFIDDPRGGEVGRSVADLNFWLSSSREWLLTPAAMQGLAAALAALLLLLALFALPVRRGPRIDGAWLRFGRPQRRDEAHGVIALAEMKPGGPGGSLLVVACVLRDQAQAALAAAIGAPEPLYTVPEAELIAKISAARGVAAGVALSRVYQRLRALPSRGQAAAPWGSGTLPRREFDALYRDVADLCRTLGDGLIEAAQ